MIPGRYVITAVGCDLAADAIGRQEPISLTRRTFERGTGSRAALILIAVEAGDENEVTDLLRPLLDAGLPAGLAGQAREKRIVLFARCPEHGLHGDRALCFVCGRTCEQVPFVQLGRE